VARKIFNGVDANSQRIINVASPSSAADAANKSYVDGLIQGLSWKNAVRAATTAAGTLASSFANASVIDGVTLATGDRILIKNQAAGAENGIYTVAASGAPTRTTDADTGAELVNATVYVSNGTTNADTAWVQTAGDFTTPPTLGTTSLTYSQVGGGSGVTAGNGLTGTTTFSVLPNGTSINVSASGIKLDTTAGGNGITVSGTGVITVNPVAGGGVTVAAGGVSVDFTLAVKKFAATIGDGSTTSIVVTHNLGTRDITYSIYDATGFQFYDTDVVSTSTNTATFTFPTAPTSNSLRVVIHG
jgi:hypothetical protein